MLTFKEFIKNKRIKLGLSQNKLAKLIGITQSYFNTIERGEVKNPPSDEVLDKIALALNLDNEDKAFMKYMAAYERTPKLIKDELKNNELKINALEKQASISLDNISQATLQIPIYERISAGLGALNYGEVEDYLYLPNLNSVNIFAINVDGDSMEPTIKNNSVILVKKDAEVRNGDIGAFLLDNEAYVKRLKVTDSYVALMSDNPNYPPIFIGPGENLIIIGKVIKMISDL